MLLDLNINHKEMGRKDLLKGFSMSVEENQKVGLIGRNGTGKSTLLNLISGIDKDFDGQISINKKARLVFTRQEHTGLGDLSLITYILEDLPEFKKLKSILDNFDFPTPTQRQLESYSNALDRFTVLGYFEVEEKIKEDLRRLQFSEKLISGQLGALSGGQKRLVEVVKIINSGANLVLMDEPTNHMDHIAKKWFVSWMSSFQGAIIVITHDRDVLHCVDKITEIKDLKDQTFKGNYDAYLKQNTQKTVNSMQDWEVIEKSIENLKKDIIRYRRLKEKSRNPGTIQNFKRMENSAAEKLAELQEVEKPTFWIDKESGSELKKDLGEKYQKHKAKNIKIDLHEKEHNTQKILSVESLSLGYPGNQLFKDLSLNLSMGERLELRGRNGVGKSTFIKALISTYNREGLQGKIFGGLIELTPLAKIGIYEQELEASYLNLTLEDAIYSFYSSLDLSLTDTELRTILSRYLFEPARDGGQPVATLSGGQKARLQLIKMFASDPNLLILDEPTNHLDLPSIEELEEALKSYTGAILYVSHDTYFRKNIAGKVLEIYPA